MWCVACFYEKEEPRWPTTTFALSALISAHNKADKQSRDVTTPDAILALLTSIQATIHGTTSITRQRRPAKAQRKDALYDTHKYLNSSFSHVVCGRIVSLLLSFVQPFSIIPLSPSTILWLDVASRLQQSRISPLESIAKWLRLLHRSVVIPLRERNLHRQVHRFPMAADPNP